MGKVFTRNIEDKMNSVQEIIKNKIIEMSELNLTDKGLWHSYYEVYPFLLDSFLENPNKNYNILEVGIYAGGMLRGLSELFPKSNIYGVDWDLTNIQIDLKNFSNITLIQSHQCDSSFVDSLPMLDFVTEDASHQMDESMKTFNLLEPKLNKGALYVIEDIYPQFYDAYVQDQRFDIYDVRDIKGRGDDVIAVYRKK